MANKDMVTWPGWETVRLIGRGSFGSVYEIQRDILGDVEKAALKHISIPQNESDIDELYSDGYDDESIVSTYKNHLKSIVAEYSLMRKMNGNTNIVSCDDIIYEQRDDGFGWDVFIKMELLTPLTKALTADVSEETVVRIAKDICLALDLCKKYGIIHRDIKPQNIFVSANGDYKLGDFGIAKTIEKTMGGTKIGTYKYMAPEVFHYQPYGSAADIYSLGLVLYWILNERRMPFLPLPPAKLTSSMDEEARHRRFSGESLPAPKHGSGQLKAIILKACAYQPNERYQSAREMLDALNSLHSDNNTSVVNKMDAASLQKETVSATAEPEAKTLNIGLKQSKERLEINSRQPTPVVKPTGISGSDRENSTQNTEGNHCRSEVMRELTPDPLKSEQKISYSMERQSAGVSGLSEVDRRLREIYEGWREFEKAYQRRN